MGDQRGPDATLALDSEPRAEADPGRSRLVRRRRVILGIAGAAVLVSTGGLVGVRFIKSPAQIAADTAEPPPSKLTAPVEKRKLTAQQTIRGQVYPPIRYDVTPVAPSPDITSLFVSKATVAAGTRVASGDFLGEVSGRPLLALKGDVPAYRDLKFGMTGSDVSQLQRALRDLGYGRGSDSDGTLGAGTAKAVAAFYKDREYPAPADANPLTTAQVPTASKTPAKAADTKSIVDGTTVLPKGEAVFLPSFPATVIETTGAVGQPANGVLLKLTTSGLVVTGQLSPNAQNQVRAGMTCAINDDSSAAKAKGTIASVGQSTTAIPTGVVVPIGGTSGTSGTTSGQGGGGNPAGGAGGATTAAYLPLSITTEQPLPSTWNGKNVRIVIDTASTSGEVLAVPLSAVVTTANGTTTVTRVAPDGTQTVVPVTTGLSADGMVEVSPAGQVELRAGDQVRVGR